jgi:hypothetical protein
MRRRIRKCLVLCIAGALAVAVPSVALANEIRDPDDVTGKLDFKKLAASKRSRRTSAVVTMVFFEGFRVQALKKPNGLTVGIDVNVDGNQDFRGTIHYTRGGLFMKLDDLGGSDPFNPLPVFRLAKDTYRVVLPSGQPYNTSGKKAFFATSKSCPSACTRDRAPDAGWLKT